MSSNWPFNDTPAEFLEEVQKLRAKDTTTIVEFIELCSLAVRIIESKDTSTTSRSAVAYHITHIWLQEKDIEDCGLTNEIGGRFSEWEIPGWFTLDTDLDLRRWAELKQWIEQAKREKCKK